MNKQDTSPFPSLPLIGLFAYTAVSKLQAPEVFSKAMLNQPLPEWLGSQLVWAIPLLEGLTVCLLLYRPLRVWGFFLATGLMLGFTGYILMILLGSFGYVPCACGGMLQELSWEQHLWANLFFLALSFWGLYISLRPASSSLKA